jgi:hypothetical protein
MVAELIFRAVLYTVFKAVLSCQSKGRVPLAVRMAILGLSEYVCMLAGGTLEEQGSVHQSSPYEQLEHLYKTANS